MKRLSNIFTLVACLLFIGAGCNPNASQPEAVSNAPVSDQASTLSQQAQCATQADKALLEFKKGVASSYTNKIVPDADFNQENHFNKKLNKCFVLISQNDLNGRYEYLGDAYENYEWAWCNTLTKPGKLDTLCEIRNTTGDEEQVDKQKYNDFVKEKMETP